MTCEKLGITVEGMSEKEGGVKKGAWWGTLFTEKRYLGKELDLKINTFYFMLHMGYIYT